jgi:hypothetical protein
MIHMKFGSKSTPFNTLRQPVWGKPIRSKLQKTAKGYYLIGISKQIVDELQLSHGSVLDMQTVDGSIVMTELKRR